MRERGSGGGENKNRGGYRRCNNILNDAFKGDNYGRAIKQRGECEKKCDKSEKECANTEEISHCTPSVTYCRALCVPHRYITPRNNVTAA